MNIELLDDAFSSERRFRLWAFHVSHSRLLFRSAMSESDPASENVDIKFFGVSYLDTTWLYHGIEIREMLGDELAKFKESHRVELGQGEKVFALNTGDQTFYICAVAYSVSTNQLPGLEFGLEGF